MGIARVLHECPTGRAFLQTHGTQLDYYPDYSHYFHTLKSQRRLQLLNEVNRSLLPSLKKFLPDELALFPQLADFDIYAGDGLGFFFRFLNWRSLSLCDRLQGGGYV